MDDDLEDFPAYGGTHEEDEEYGDLDAPLRLPESALPSPQEALKEEIRSTYDLLVRDLPGDDASALLDQKYLQKCRTLFNVRCFQGDEEAYRRYGAEASDQAMWCDLAMCKGDWESKLYELRNKNNNSAVGKTLSTKERAENERLLDRCYQKVAYVAQVLRAMQCIHQLRTGNDDVLIEQATFGCLTEATMNFYMYEGGMPKVSNPMMHMRQQAASLFRRYNLRVDSDGVLYSRLMAQDTTECKHCGRNMWECTTQLRDDMICEGYEARRPPRYVYCRQPITEDMTLMVTLWARERGVPKSVQKNRIATSYTPTLEAVLPWLICEDCNPGIYVLGGEKMNGACYKDIAGHLVKGKGRALPPYYVNNQCFSCQNGVLNCYDTSIEPNAKGHRWTFKTFDEMDEQKDCYKPECGARLSDSWFDHTFDVSSATSLEVFSKILGFQGITTWQEIRPIAAMVGAGLLRSGIANNKLLPYVLKITYMVVLHGKAGTGKSVFIDAFVNLFQKSDTCCWTTAGSESFSLEKACHYLGDHVLMKTFQYSYEWGRGMIDMNVLKAAVIGERLVVNGKNKKELESKGMCSLMFACNDLPTLKNDHGELSRRILFMPFTKRIPLDQIDTDLPRRIKEQAGLLAYVCTQAALEMNKLCTKENVDPMRTKNEEIMPKFFQESSKILRNSNPVYMFLQDLTVYEHKYYRALNETTMEFPRLKREPHRYMTMNDFITVLRTWGNKSTALGEGQRINIRNLKDADPGLSHALEDAGIEIVSNRKMKWFLPVGTAYDEPERRREQRWLLGIGFVTHLDASANAFKFDSLYDEVAAAEEKAPDDMVGESDVEENVEDLVIQASQDIERRRKEMEALGRERAKARLRRLEKKLADERMIFNSVFSKRKRSDSEDSEDPEDSEDSEPDDSEFNEDNDR